MITILLFTSLVLQGQSGYKVEGDSILTKFLHAAEEAGWKLIENDQEGVFLIERLDTMWVDFYNSAGAPVDDPVLDKYTDEWLIENARPQVASLRITMETKWSGKKIAETQAHNKKIGDQLRGLKKKHGIDHLKSSYRYSDEIFWDAEDKDRKNIQKYEKEKEALMAKRINVPSYNTQKYSIVRLSRNWEQPPRFSYMRPMIAPEEEEKKVEEMNQFVREILYNPLPDLD